MCRYSKDPNPGTTSSPTTHYCRNVHKPWKRVDNLIGRTSVEFALAYKSALLTIAVVITGSYALTDFYMIMHVTKCNKIASEK